MLMLMRANKDLFYAPFVKVASLVGRLFGPCMHPYSILSRLFRLLIQTLYAFTHKCKQRWQ